MEVVYEKTAAKTPVSFGASARNAAVSPAGGNGTAENPYEIDSLEDLNMISDHAGAHYRLTKDIQINGKINFSVGHTIKKGTDVLLSNVTKNIENEFENQVNNMEYLNKYINNWKEYFNAKDFEGMQKEYYKINEKIKEVAPIEKTIKIARNVQNLHQLIKNNGKNFDLSNEEIALAKLL